MTQPLRIGALISGGGRTVINIAEHIDNGDLDASIEMVISSRASAPGVERVKELGLDVRVAEQSDFSTEDELHDIITKWLNECEVDLVCLCGYLRWMRVDPRYHGRIINIHPALLPDFGGKGMFGNNVHRAVLASNRSVTGCTVHFVDDQYDHGPTILQRTCPILRGDDEFKLAARVFEQECIAYPAAIHLFAEDRVKLENGKAKILTHSQ